MANLNSTPRLWFKPALAGFFVLLMAGCSVTPPGIDKPVCWSELPGWQQDSLVEALPALQSQCPRLTKESNDWRVVCDALERQSPSTDQAVQTFLQQYFVPHNVVGNGGSAEGLITGYYEPTLYGSLRANERYHYPIYRSPEDLLTVRMESRFPELKDQRVRARIENNIVVPYYSREQIDAPESPLAGQELLWVDDPDAAFFLHVQGSGRVMLEDGSMVGVGYANQNGHPYVSIGKVLIDLGELEREAVSLQSIRDWLKRHPERANQIKNSNPSYVFFTLRKDLENGPRGSLNVPLTTERSVAIDRRVIPLGTPLWLSTTLPDSQKPYQRLVFAQDTGGAINGPVRADLFFGRGERAERLAGTMKQSGQLFALMPKTGEEAECR